MRARRTGAGVGRRAEVRGELPASFATLIGPAEGFTVEFFPLMERRPWEDFLSDDCLGVICDPLYQIRGHI